MKSLLTRIESLRNSPIKSTIDSRLSEFASFKKKCNDEWFSELCFCLLTANSKAHTAINIQKQLGPEGFILHPRSRIRSCIRKNKHRFQNNKSRFIVEARKFRNIKSNLANNDSISTREWLVKNIKGLGYKEASHFLRNTGTKDLAILDRHILNLMGEHKIIKRPKSLNKKSYLDIEHKFNLLAKKANMSSAELDLYLWYIKTGEVLK